MLVSTKLLQIGLSYDTPTNVTLDIEKYNLTGADFSSGYPKPNSTLLVGTSASLVIILLLR